jgi:ATP adenylyltransferase
MDRLWTPWRYSYITATERGPAADAALPKGVPVELAGWPGPDRQCIFCNLIAAVDWAIKAGMAQEEAELTGLVVARGPSCFVCLNRYPYASGHVMILPYRHTDSLAKLPAGEAEEMMRTAQQVETVLRAVYHPDGLNLGMNLGKAAGAGIAEHIHLHAVPRWVGDTNFMTVTAETRVLPEALDATWQRVRAAFTATCLP